ADGLGPAPLVDRLEAPHAVLAQHELAADARRVEQLQRPVDGRRRGGVAELVRAQDAPVPVVVGVRLGVAGDDQRRRLDVARLVDAQVELEVAPVRRQDVEDLLEVVRQAHRARSLRKFQGPTAFEHPVARLVPLIALLAALAVAPAAHAQLPAGGFTSDNVKFVKNFASSSDSSGARLKDGYFYITT